MLDFLAAIVLSLLIVVVAAPEVAGEWLKKIDDVRYENTMCE